MKEHWNIQYCAGFLHQHQGPWSVYGSHDQVRLNSAAAWVLSNVWTRFGSGRAVEVVSVWAWATMLVANVLGGKHKNALRTDMDRSARKAELFCETALLLQLRGQERSVRKVFLVWANKDCRDCPVVSGSIAKKLLNWENRGTSGNLLSNRRKLMHWLAVPTFLCSCWATKHPKIPGNLCLTIRETKN